MVPVLFRASSACSRSRVYEAFGVGGGTGKGEAGQRCAAAEINTGGIDANDPPAGAAAAEETRRDQLNRVRVLGVQAGEHVVVASGKGRRGDGVGEHVGGGKPAGATEAADVVHPLDGHPEDVEVGEAGVERGTRVTGEEAPAQARLIVAGDAADEGDPRRRLRIGVARALRPRARRGRRRPGSSV